MENNSNINNQFIPYNLALELKGLGFKNNWNFKEYDTMGYLQHTGLLDSHKLEAIDAPLYQQAFLYLWNKTGRYIIPIPNDDKEWLCMGNKFKTYEEARLECLKKLIEIVKNESK